MNFVVGNSYAIGNNVVARQLYRKAFTVVARTNDTITVRYPNGEEITTSVKKMRQYYGAKFEMAEVLGEGSHLYIYSA